MVVLLLHRPVAAAVELAGSQKQRSMTVRLLLPCLQTMAALAVAAALLQSRRLRWDSLQDALPCP
jgi:hypothetical protein